MSITLHSTIRPTHEPDGETRQIQATGDTYDDARSALDAQVRDGWQLLGISRWP